MSNLSNDYDVRLATLKKLGGDMTKKYATIYDVDLAILDKIGQGGGGGGSLTPEQEEILEKLTNSSNGAYYTTEIAPNGGYISVDGYDTNTKNYCQIGDDFYMYSEGNIFKYNPSTFSFTQLNESWINNLNTYNRFWKDKSGRVHFGFNYEFDLNTLQMTDHMVSQYSTSSEADYINIIIGKYGIYNLWGRDYVVFNEAEDRFYSEVKHLPEPVDGQSYDFYDSFYKSLQNVDGRFISIFDNMTFEVIENPDATINIIKIDDFWDWNNMPFGVQYYNSLKYINGYWYYVKGSLYKCIDGKWTVVNDNFNFNGNSFNEDSLPQNNSYNGLMFGPKGFPDYYISPLIVNYTYEPVKSTTWTPSKNFAVDLESNQNIKGTKTFENGVVIKQHLTVNGVSSDGNYNLEINSSKNTNINAIDFVNLQKNTLIEGDYAASKSDTIQNSEIVYPGIMEEFIDSICGNPYWYMYAVFNNKLYYCNYDNKYVFDGESIVLKDNWYPAEELYMSQCAKITSNRFFITKNNNIYELVNDEWVVRVENNPYANDVIIPFEDTLICGLDGKKLNTTTWVWEDWLGHSFDVLHIDGVFEFNNITYQIRNSYLDKFNPETGQFEQYMEFITWEWTANSEGNRFIHNGNIYIQANGGPWYLVDLENRVLTEQNMKANYNIPVFSLNGKTYTLFECQIYLIYNKNYTKPALPNNGLDYSLTAKSTNGKVEYSYAGMWSGTQAEWDALPVETQNSIKIALITE